MLVPFLVVSSPRFSYSLYAYVFAWANWLSSLCCAYFASQTPGLCSASIFGSLSLCTRLLANDVTLVTSYGYCQSLKINDIRTYMIRKTSVLRFVRLGGYSVRRWVGVCTRRLKLLPYQRHKPYSLYYSSTSPGL